MTWPGQAGAALFPTGPAEAPSSISRKSERLPARKEALAPEVPAVDLPAQPGVSEPKAPSPVASLEPSGPVLPPDAGTDQDDEAAASDPRPAGLGAPSGPVPSTLTPREIEMQKRGIVRAEVRPARPYLLSVPFAATLEAVHVHDGEDVTAGQVLAVLDKRGAEKDLEDMRLAVNKAVERVQALEGRPGSEQEKAREHLAASADKLREAEERLSLTTLRAPYQARITEVRANAGQHLRRGEAVLELAERGDLEIISQIPSSWVSRLRPGHIIWVFIEETNKSYEAEFVRFGGKVNTAGKTIRAYARFSVVPEELLPGMSGRADFFPRPSR